jgi:hypothetical protein
MALTANHSLTFKAAEVVVEKHLFLSLFKGHFYRGYYTFETKQKSSFKSEMLDKINMKPDYQCS